MIASIFPYFVSILLKLQSKMMTYYVVLFLLKMFFTNITSLSGMYSSK